MATGTNTRGVVAHCDECGYPRPILTAALCADCWLTIMREQRSIVDWECEMECGMVIAGVRLSCVECNPQHHSIDCKGVHGSC